MGVASTNKIQLRLMPKGVGKCTLKRCVPSGEYKMTGMVSTSDTKKRLRMSASMVRAIEANPFLRCNERTTKNHYGGTKQPFSKMFFAEQQPCPHEGKGSVELERVQSRIQRVPKQSPYTQKHVDIFGGFSCLLMQLHNDSMIACHDGSRIDIFPQGRLPTFGV